MLRVVNLIKLLTIFFFLFSTIGFANAGHCSKKHDQHSTKNAKAKTASRNVHKKMMLAEYKPARKTRVQSHPDYKDTQPDYKGECAAKKVVYHRPCKPVPVRKRCYKDAPPCRTGLCDGFYVGLAGGVDSYRMHQQFSAELPGDAFLLFNPTLNAVGMVSALYAGYGKYFDNFYYVGGEIFGNISGASTSYSANVSTPVSASISTTRISADRVYGISILPGLKVNNDSLIYLRLGYNRAGITTSESYSLIGLASGGNSRRNWVNGIAYGIGIETLVYQNWSVRGEYTHTEYQSFNSPTTIIPTIEGPAITVPGPEYFPSNNQYMLGISYHF